jgi:hypothetical protein
MRRRLFAAASAISLLLCLASVGLWVRSYWLYDEIAISHRSSLWQSNGRIGVDIWLLSTKIAAYESGATNEDWFHGLIQYKSQRLLGFCWFRGPLQPLQSAASAPDWFVVILTAILPAAWIAKRLSKARQRGHRLCLICSYNLTGNSTGVCPECGTPVAQPPKSSAPSDDKDPRPA